MSGMKPHVLVATAGTLVGDLLGTLRALEGYYKCPKDADGKRLGPLVGYTAQYEPGMHWVGDEYLNFAELEQYPFLVHNFAEQLSDEIFDKIRDVDVFLGAPEGGKTVAEMLGLVSSRRYVYPEKEVLVLKTATEREKSRWIWGRHAGHIYKGDKVAICEDLMNNFATTDKLVDLVEKHGAEVVCITGWYNRSLKLRDTYHIEAGERWAPIIALDGKPVPQFRQDDPFVAEDVAAGKVVWKAKHDWPRLEAAMAQATK